MTKISVLLPRIVSALGYPQNHQNINYVLQTHFKPRCECSPESTSDSHNGGKSAIIPTDDAELPGTSVLHRKVEFLEDLT